MDLLKKRYRAQMAAPDAALSIELLAALSRHTNFSLGCYCQDEDGCHRSVPRELLLARGALAVARDQTGDAAMALRKAGRFTPV